MSKIKEQQKTQAQVHVLYKPASFFHVLQVVSVATTGSTDDIKPMRIDPKRTSACRGSPC